MLQFRLTVLNDTAIMMIEDFFDDCVCVRESVVIIDMLLSCCRVVA